MAVTLENSPSGEVAAEETHKHKKEQHGGHQAPAVRGRQESEHGEHHGDEGHAEDLHTSAHVHGEGARELWGAEHIAVHL